jgi:uncharacterized protein YfiM (DUF2279 family)
MRTLMLVFALRADLGGGPAIGADKLKHFLLGSFTQSVGYSTARLAGLDRQRAIAAGSALTIGVATLKEVRDRQGRGDPSLWDAGWTIAGGAAITPLLVQARK